jgi:hypothetical protein
MSIFDSKKVAWRKGVANNTDTSTRYRELEQTYGEKRTKEYVELMYTKAKDQNNNLLLDGSKGSMAVVAALLKGERDAVLQRRGFYQGYMTEAKSGQLGRDVDNNLRDVNDYYKNKKANGLTGRNLAVDQAANWLCGDYTAALPSTRTLLEEYIPAVQGHHGKLGPCLGTSTDALWKVHKRLVPGCLPTRLATKFINKYPSTVGAGYLFEELYLMVSGQRVWPNFGDAHWLSIATFYLGSIGTIQVFPDGNKRMSRFAYSVVLIKGTHTFKAPTDAHALSLYRMQG